MEKTIKTSENASEQNPQSSEREKIEAMIDEALDETFPASDPPSWTSLAIRNRSYRRREEADPEKSGAEAKKSA